MGNKLGYPSTCVALNRVLQHVWGWVGDVDPKEINGANVFVHYNITSPKDETP